jgi:2-oxoisovalerate dehydrogenase E2 component (dihydrolipoyl transacylase)
VGEGTAEAEIVKWHVAAGERIDEDQLLVEVETEKAVTEIPAPVSGTVISIHGAVGERLAIGSELVVIETEAAAARKARSRRFRSKGRERRKRRRGRAGVACGRARARQLGVELHVVHGSGPCGRVTHADLDNSSRLEDAGRRASCAACRRRAADGVEEQRIVGIRRKIAERMQESSRRSRTFSYVEEVDVTALEELRST